MRHSQQNRPAVAPAAAIVLLCICGTALAAETKTRSFIGTEDNKRIYDLPVMKLLGDSLNGKFKNLQVVISSCKSGGFADEAEAHLRGKYAASVIRNKVKDAAVQQLNDSDTYKGETGYKTGTSNFTVFGWDAQWAKKLNASPNSTFEELHNEATAKEFDQASHAGGFPKLVKNGDGEKEKVKVAAGAGEAIYWDNYGTDIFYHEYATLQRSGYSDATRKNARIDAAYKNFDDFFLGTPSDDINGAEPPVYSDRKANGDALKAMAAGLATRLGNSSDKTAFVYIGGHGNVEKVKGDTLPDAAFAAAQGADIHNGEGSTLDLDPDFVSTFFEGTAVMTPGTIREIPASIGLRTYSEGLSGSVQVKLDGVAIGSMLLTSSPNGGDYSLDIPDTVMFDLYSQGLLSDMQASITFDFPLGTPSMDSFKVATEWDVDLGLREYYGIGLAAPSILVIPAPGAAALLAGLSLLTVRRRRQQ